MTPVGEATSLGILDDDDCVAKDRRLAVGTEYLIKLGEECTRRLGKLRDCRRSSKRCSWIDLDLGMEGIAPTCEIFGKFQ